MAGGFEDAYPHRTRSGHNLALGFISLLKGLQRGRQRQQENEMFEFRRQYLKNYLEKYSQNEKLYDKLRAKYGDYPNEILAKLLTAKIKAESSPGHGGATGAWIQAKLAAVERRKKGTADETDDIILGIKPNNLGLTREQLLLEHAEKRALAHVSAEDKTGLLYTPDQRKKRVSDLTLKFAKDYNLTQGGNDDSDSHDQEFEADMNHGIEEINAGNRSVDEVHDYLMGRYGDDSTRASRIKSVIKR